MQSSDKPNAAETRWREDVRSLNSMISGLPGVIHHCVGTTGRHNKVRIGHWWLLCLTPDEHRALHADPHRKIREKVLFRRTLAHAHERALSLPSAEIVEAILDYHK